MLLPVKSTLVICEGNAEKSKVGPYPLLESFTSFKFGRISKPERSVSFVLLRSSETVEVASSFSSNFPSLSKEKPFEVRIFLNSVFFSTLELNAGLSFSPQELSPNTQNANKDIIKFLVSICFLN